MRQLPRPELAGKDCDGSARYKFDPIRDLVLVARIRHQGESGYSEGERLLDQLVI